MNEEYKVMLVHSGEARTAEEQLRDKVEVLKCEIENLEMENAALIKALADAGIEWKGLPDLNE